MNTPLPSGRFDDIKRDIAKVVRSIEWVRPGGIGGMCFLRAITGWTTLCLLKIPAKPALGGMVYRAGPDEHCDVIAFCGEGNAGRRSVHGMLAHYFIASGEDIVDFSVGDWKDDSETIPEVVIKGATPLPPVRWTAPPLPDFFWTHRDSFMPKPPAYAPALGEAWYTGFADDGSFFEALIEDTAPDLKRAVPHIVRGIEFYALKERLFAANVAERAQLRRLIES